MVTGHQNTQRKYSSLIIFLLRTDGTATTNCCVIRFSRKQGATMPKKPNSHGNDQEYVPAGNGDASGEYADEQGGNKHFTSFSKPDDTNNIVGNIGSNGGQIKTGNDTIIEKEREEQSKPVKKSRNIKEAITDHITNPNHEYYRVVEKLEQETNEESKQIISNYLGDNQELSITFQAPTANAAGEAWRWKKITTCDDVHTVRHELGHTFDSYCIKDEENKHYEWGIEQNLSTHYIDEEEGKTFNQVLHEEMGMHPYEHGYLKTAKTGIDKRQTKLASIQPMIDAYDEYGDKLVEKATGESNVSKRLAQLQQDMQARRDKAVEDWHNSEEFKNYQDANNALSSAYSKYREQEHAKGNWFIDWDDVQDESIINARTNRDLAYKVSNQKYDELVDSIEIQEMRKEESRLRDLKYKIGYKDMKGVASILGDITDYAGVGNPKYSTTGHGSYYFSERKLDGIAMEVFANMFDVRAANKDGRSELLAKMLPRTYAVFDRIMNKFGKRG